MKKSFNDYLEGVGSSPDHETDQEEQDEAVFQELVNRVEDNRKSVDGLRGEVAKASESRNPGNPGNPGDPGVSTAQAVPVVIVQPDGRKAVKDSEDLNELRNSVKILEAALGFNAGLALSNREELRDMKIENDLGLFEEKPKTFKDKQKRMPMKGDAAFMIAQEALGDLEAGKINLREYHSELAWLLTTPETELLALYAGVKGTEEEEGEEEN